MPRLVDAGLGTNEAPVLDLGCGRGEWLEVLKDRGLQARGVDINRAMLERCRAIGLDVAEGDALASLTGTPAASSAIGSPGSGRTTGRGSSRTVSSPLPIW